MTSWSILRDILTLSFYIFLEDLLFLFSDGLIELSFLFDCKEAKLMKVGRMRRFYIHLPKKIQKIVHQWASSTHLLY